LTLQFVLRTLARVQMMTRLDEKLLAEQLIEEYGSGSKAWGIVVSAGDYLEGVAEAIKNKIGHDACYARPGGDPNCPQCGEKVERDRADARYCSDRCRQRAYRLRLKKRRRTMKRNKPAVHDTSICAGNETTATHQGKALSSDARLMSDHSTDAESVP
jgi:hypothetical protein